MSVYIDKKYISLLSPKLSQFKQRGEFLWNFRCNICGDSNKDKTKARGYIYKRKDHFSFICHNCGSAMRLDKFIRYSDPGLYNEYQLETFQEKHPQKDKDKEFVMPEEFLKAPVFKSKTNKLTTNSLTPLEDLPANFYARKYIDDRKVPLKGLYYASDFAAYIRDQFPSYDKQLYKEARIVIPFYDREGNLLGVQGRSIGPSKIKYITIKTDENSPKIFGWNKVDLAKPIFVVEGPIDSLFLDNCVATMDAALYTCPRIIGLDFDYVFIYDCEPRNRQIVKNMRKTIDLGYKVCIWPSDITFKDINEGILQGYTPATIQHIIDCNTYEGMMATMKLNQWEKTV